MGDTNPNSNLYIVKNVYHYIYSNITIVLHLFTPIYILEFVGLNIYVRVKEYINFSILYYIYFFTDIFINIENQLVISEFPSSRMGMRMERICHPMHLFACIGK